MAHSIVRLYEQMLELKHVIAIRACTIIGKIFNIDLYGIIQGVDKLISVDGYLWDCLPKPRIVINITTKVRKKIS